MAFKTISGTVELTTGAYTPSETSPVYQLENGATLLSLDLENDGSPYTLTATESAYVKLYYPGSSSETAEVLMTKSAGNVQVELSQVLTAVSGQAVALIMVKDSGGDVLFSCSVPLPIIRTSGTAVTAYEEPAAGTVAYLEGLIDGKQDLLTTGGIVKDDGAGNASAAADGTDYLSPTTGIQKSIIDAKGDMIVGSADDTPVRLPVGANGTVLTADSAESGGIKWSASGSGDMQAATYDPTAVNGDAFDMDNMAQGDTNKFISAAEKTVLENTSGTNTGDQVLPTRDSLGLDTDDTVTFANLSGTNTGDQTLASLGAAALLILAAEYAETTYALGAFVSRATDGKFYECTTAIETPEAWTAGHWTERTIGYVLAALATADAQKVAKALFTAHTIIYATTSGTPAALTVDEQKLIGRLTGGNIAAISIGIADNNIVQIDHASVADDDFARFTANGLEGRSASETLADIGAQAKATISENTNAAPALGTIANNKEYRCTNASPTAAPTMTIAAISANTTEFACNVIYKAKSASPSAPSVTNNSGKTIKYQGDDVISGTFTPSASVVYRLGWVWDGIYLNCYIKGVK